MKKSRRFVAKLFLVGLFAAALAVAAPTILLAESEVGEEASVDVPNSSEEDTIDLEDLPEDTEFVMDNGEIRLANSWRY